MFFQNLRKINKKKGFSLLEMILVVAIFGIITSVVIFNYSDFNSSTIMTNTAYEIALAIREAQVYSLGVRGNISSNDYDVSYGTYFNAKDNGGSKKDFVFFGNYDEDASCDGCSMSICDSGSECQQIISMNRGIEIERICVSPSSIDPVTDSGGCDGTSRFVLNQNELVITFDRPDPDALIYVDGDISRTYSSAGIVLEHNGNRRAVIVRDNGQISVKFINN